jgi:hypothetical protein
MTYQNIQQLYVAAVVEAKKDFTRVWSKGPNNILLLIIHICYELLKQFDRAIGMSTANYKSKFLTNP